MLAAHMIYLLQLTEHKRSLADCIIESLAPYMPEQAMICMPAGATVRRMAC
jgi:hypothetical protein